MGRFLLAAWLVVVSSLAGCWLPGTGQTQHVLSLGRTANVTSEGGHTTLTVYARLPQRQLFATINPYTAADVARLVVTLHKRVSGVTGPAIATLEHTNPAAFGSALRFTHLRAQTTYVLRGTAFPTLGSAISDPTRSEQTVIFTNNTTPPPVTLSVALLDRAFVNQADLPAVGLLDGTLRDNRGLVDWYAGTAGVVIEDQLLPLGIESCIKAAPDGTLYVTDSQQHRIRRIDLNGVMTTLAGSIFPGNLDGTGAAAQFNSPRGLAFDASATLYIADTNNHRIRKVSPTGVVTTWAGSSMGNTNGTGTLAQFANPHGLVVDASGTVYVADSVNHLIRRITPAGVVSTFAGSTQGSADSLNPLSAQFNQPRDLALGPDGTLYVADTFNARIRQISATGVVSTLAGSSFGYQDGTGAGAQFNQPQGIALLSDGTLAVADHGNHRIRRVTKAGVVTTLAGGNEGGVQDGLGTAAQILAPWGIGAGTAGSLFFTDTSGVRALAHGSVITLAPNGRGSQDGALSQARFLQPEGIAVDGSGNVYVSDTQNHRIRKIIPDSSGFAFSTNLNDGRVTTLAGSVAGYQDATASNARFNLPSGLAVASDGTIYVADRNNHRIRVVSAAGAVTTLAGSTQGLAEGTGAAAQFDSPDGLAVDASGTIYVADTNNHRIRRITPGGEVSTYAGSTQGDADGVATAAQFFLPKSLCVNASGTVYVADTGNHRIRAITPGGVVSTLAGSSAGTLDGFGTAAQFSSPRAICVTPTGTLYVAGDRLCRVTPAGAVTTLAGGGGNGYRNGLGTAARFSTPSGLAVTASGTIYVVDTFNHVVRVVR
ncbi:MAG: NHL repeat-containing protein [Candidatus Sericytochromatia bacterium]|nr:NHL repeat-containing protein [Candidatus Sericytochromatia bacterium]